MATSIDDADSVRVFIPIGKETAAKSAASAAARPQNRPGTPFVIGLLDNHKHNSDAVLDRLQHRLAEKLPGASFIRMKKPEAGKGAPPAMLEELAAQCQAVVNGIGD